MIARIDAGPLERTLIKIGTIGDGVIGFMGSIIGFFVAVMCLVAAFGEGEMLWLIPTALYVFIMVKGVHAFFFRGIESGYYYDDDSTMAKATKLYYKLNNDNKAIARPVVLDIYEKAPIQAADGSYLYKSHVRESYKALEGLLNEQSAVEKAIAAANATLQRANANASTHDVQRVLDYTKAMRETRHDFLQKNLEITG